MMFCSITCFVTSLHPSQIVSGESAMDATRSTNLRALLEQVRSETTVTLHREPEFQKHFVVEMARFRSSTHSWLVADSESMSLNNLARSPSVADMFTQTEVDKSMSQTRILISEQARKLPVKVFNGFTQHTKTSPLPQNKFVFAAMMTLIWQIVLLFSKAGNRGSRVCMLPCCTMSRL